MKKPGTQAYTINYQLQLNSKTVFLYFLDPNDFYINEKTKIFTLFRMSSSFLSDIHYVIISKKCRSIFVIATKKTENL